MTFSSSRRIRPLLSSKLKKLMDYKYQRRTANWTLVIAVISIIGVALNGYWTRESNKRAEKVFGAQMLPWVQAKPSKFVMEKNSRGHIFGTTSLRIVNFTNFDACNVKTDVKYQKEEWIREWQQAKVNDCEKRNLQQLSRQEKEECEDYKKFLNTNIGNLIVEAGGKCPTLNEKTLAVTNDSKIPVATGAVTVRNHSKPSASQELIQIWKGGWPSECDPCARNSQCLVTIRTMWENEKGRQFESIDYYNLRCTQLGQGTSFTFIPIKLELDRSSL